MTLEARLNAFLESLPDAESVDALIPSGSHPGKKRADYLLADRKVVVEVKLLATDTSPKIQTELKRHESRSDYPLVYGEVDLQEILSRMDDGKKINERIYRNITRSVEEAARSAESQIHDTREILRLETSLGLLVLLNEDVHVLSPDIVAHKTGRVLWRKGGAEGSPSPVDFVWLIFESHAVAHEGATAFCSFLLEGPRGRSAPWFSKLFAELQIGWARANNASLVRSQVERLSDLGFSPATKMKP
jgi:hypothetical protein